MPPSKKNYNICRDGELIVVLDSLEEVRKFTSLRMEAVRDCLNWGCEENGYTIDIAFEINEQN